jgi:hypothetical protein
VQVTDGWGTLEAGGGALLVRDAEGRFTEVRVPAPAVDAGAQGAGAAGRTLSGDGWTLRLADGWKAVPGARPGDLTLARED